MEILLAFVLGWGVQWWTTPEPIPHKIEYQPKTVLLGKYNPVDDCKETDTVKCSNPSPRIVMTEHGYGQFTDRFIDTRSELNKCIIKVDEHNRNPISFKPRSVF